MGAAAGVTIGPALVYHGEVEGPVRLAGTPEEERSRLADAMATVARDFDRLVESAGHEAREIVEAHRLMLSDPELESLVHMSIDAGKSAGAAVSEAIEQFASMLAALDDAYLRERAADVRDVGRRLLAALSGAAVGLKLDRPCIVLARDLAPTDTIGVERSLLLGIATEQGGPTSHTCILARSWGIPAVVATPGLLAAAKDGGPVALDGKAGVVILNPSPETVAQFEERSQQGHAQREVDLTEAHLPAETPDGRRVELAANGGSPADVPLAVELGAEGIGLLRSEFLFMGHQSAPDEDEQYWAYRHALEHAHGGRVIIRTLDIGGDKNVPYLGIPKEENPFLGVRALRLCFRRPELFQTQLRAILRAGVHGRPALMFPMVANLDELRRAKAALEEARLTLEARGVPYGNPEVGIMVEIPSAALIAEHLAAEVDFFSIGTNDLTQYALAVDRGNPELTSLYQPYHPAVLRLIDMVVRAAHGRNKWVGVCGELAGQQVGALLLLGLGVDELSMSTPLLPAVRRLIRRTPYHRAQAVAREALALGSPDDVLALAEPLVK
ncbi:MAG TPA: phosphoenolpyruvate--protein phosphotransferase [Symbiobacteriaceae bacterium]|jgi:phosphotransferase system enzyme I (PtsI)